MIAAAGPAIPTAEPCTIAGEPWIRGDVGKDGKDKLVREFENWEMGDVNTRSKEVMQGPVLRLVCGARGPRDLDSGTMAGRCFRCASPVKNAEVFSRM